MISRISSFPVSFKANEFNNVRDAYSKELAENKQIAQGQNDKITSNYAGTSSLKNQIPMQGAQKLDVIA